MFFRAPCLTVHSTSPNFICVYMYVCVCAYVCMAVSGTGHNMGTLLTHTHTYTYIQETLVNLAALLVGLYLTPLVAGHPE